MTTKKGTGKKKRGCLITVFFVLIIIVVAIVGMIIFVSKNIKTYDNVDYSSLDLSKVDDGTYIGTEDGGMVKAQVRVSVSNHKITNVTILKHECGKGKPAEVIMKDIVNSNSVEVDGVSGATLSSNVLKTAVYNALTKKDQE